jgi:hypothetical protein
MDVFPPPHRVLYEALNDKATQTVWTEYTARYADQAEFETVDAAVLNGMDDFAKWFTQWMSFVPNRVGVRCRVLMVWHAQFLSLACQQMLRRSLEQRSFRCRIWFHIEEPLLQQAILSRCIVTVLPGIVHTPVRVGPPVDASEWTDPRKAETDFAPARK